MIWCVFSGAVRGGDLGSRKAATVAFFFALYRKNKKLAV